MSIDAARESEIRRFTAWILDRNGIYFARPRLRLYARNITQWESMRLTLDGMSPEEDDLFLDLSAVLREIVSALRLPLICDAATAGPDGVPGITDRNGFICGDPNRIVFGCWSDAVANGRLLSAYELARR